MGVIVSEKEEDKTVEDWAKKVEKKEKKRTETADEGI